MTRSVIVLTQKLNKANDTNHGVVMELWLLVLTWVLKKSWGFPYCFCYVYAQDFLSVLFKLGAFESILLSVNLAARLHLSDIADPDPVTPNCLLKGRFDSWLPQIAYDSPEILGRRPQTETQPGAGRPVLEALPEALSTWTAGPSEMADWSTWPTRKER